MIRRCAGSLALVTALALFLSLESSLFADGLVRDGIGPISTGRGGTNQAFADNSVIILDNPAGMVNIAGDGMAEIGVDTVITSVSYSDPYNNVDGAVRPIPAPVIGLIKKSEDGRWAFGLGAFSPAGFGSSYGYLDTPFAGSQYTRSIGALGKILPAISFKATDRLALGLSVGIAASYASLEGPLIMQTGPLAGAPAIMDIEGTGVAPCGSVGMQYRLTERMMIGCTYTEQTNVWVHGGSNVQLLPGPFLDGHFDSKVKLKWPRSVAFGLKYDLCPHRRFAAEVIWYDWAHAFDQVDIVMYNPSNPQLQTILDNAGATLPLKSSLPINWMNSVSMRLGYEYDWTDFDTFRFGYVYHSSPSPDSTLNPYLDGILQHAFSLGYSRRVKKGSLNFGYQYNFGETRHVVDSGLIGGQFDDSSMNAQAHFAMISFLMPF